jgi:hypothetical protein
MVMKPWKKKEAPTRKMMVKPWRKAKNIEQPTTCLDWKVL